MPNIARAIKAKYIHMRLRARLPFLHDTNLEDFFDDLERARECGFLQEFCDQYLNIEKWPGSQNILRLCRNPNLQENFSIILNLVAGGTLKLANQNRYTIYHELMNNKNIRPRWVRVFEARGINLNISDIRGLTPIHNLVLNRDIDGEVLLELIQELTSSNRRVPIDWDKMAYFDKIHGINSNQNLTIRQLMRLCRVDISESIRIEIDRAMVRVIREQVMEPSLKTKRDKNKEFKKFQAHNENASSVEISAAALTSLNNLIKRYGKKDFGSEDIIKTVTKFIETSDYVSVKMSKGALKRLGNIAKFTETFSNSDMNSKQILALIWHAAEDNTSSFTGKKLTAKEIEVRKLNIIDQLNKSENADEVGQHSCEQGFINRCFLSLTGLHPDIWIVTDKAETLRNFIYDKAWCLYEKQDEDMQKRLIKNWDNKKVKIVAGFIRDLQTEIKLRISKDYGNLFEESQVDAYVSALKDSLDLRQVIEEIRPGKKIVNPSKQEMQALVGMEI